VKRNRDAWVQFGGTRSGSWLIAIGTAAGLSVSDPLPPPASEDVVLLGVAHKDCIKQARDRLRLGAVELDDVLPALMLDIPAKDDPSLRVNLPAAVNSCPFCGVSGGRMTVEDIFPMWLMKELRRRGARPLDGRPTRHIVGPTTPVCADCNNNWMSVLENDVKDALLSLVDHARPINAQEQLLLATWATMKAILFETLLSTRNVPRGFAHDLRIDRKPHRGTYVWIAAYCDGTGNLQVIPWLIFAEDSDDIIAVCITFTVVKVVFQVLIPFMEGDLSPKVESFFDSVKMIFPRPTENLIWPLPYCFDESSIKALSCRIYDNREPVIMDVTMRRSQVHGKPQGNDA
jgi:hypothetical protein